MMKAKKTKTVKTTRSPPPPPRSVRWPRRHGGTEVLPREVKPKDRKTRQLEAGRSVGYETK